MIEDVRAAQLGDAVAFGRLVQRFRGAAVGYARRWLGASEAEDVAQDAFIEAFRALPQLRDPRAFPGWLRAVVRKHCDRRTRRWATFAPTPLETEVDLGASLSDQHEQAETEAWLRAAVEALPEHQRMAVALHYFGESSVRDVAAFLGVEVDAVKKRLQRARARLAEVADPAEPVRPVLRGPRLDAHVQLFVALRAKDEPAVRGVLDAHPELIDAPESWSDAEALAGSFPLAHRRTPLILAAASGALPLVELLLDRGADVDLACGCAQGETALFVAALHGHAAIVRRLLQAGADPGPPNGAGFSAVDVARLRGHADVLEALGATIPPGASKGDRRRDPVDGSTAVGADTEGAVVPTGIRALDLVAPLGPRALVRVFGAAETGLMVLVAELSRVAAERGACVWTTGDEAPMSWGDLSAFVREAGIAPAVTVAGADALEVLASRAPEGPTSLFLFVPEGRGADVDVALPRLQASVARVFVIEPWTALTRGDRSPPEVCVPPWDAQIVTDPERAGRGVFPALDLKRTTSRHLGLTPRHARVRDAVRAMDSDPCIDAVIAQPFAVWTHQTGRAGESSTLDETLDAFERVASARSA